MRSAIYTLLLLIGTSQLKAQFERLVVDPTGLRVWFSTTNNLRGTEGAAKPRIYSVTAAGVELFAEPPGNDDPLANAWFDRVSDDGNVVGWTFVAGVGKQAKVPMIGISPPPTIVTRFLRRYSDGKEWTGLWNPSRNGRWAQKGTGAIDLETNREYDFYSLFIISTLADDGSALVWIGPWTGTMSPGGVFRVLPESSGETWFQMLDREGRNMVWRQQDPLLPEARLLMRDNSTGVIRTLLEDCWSCGVSDLSGDARRLLLRTKSLAGSPIFWVLDTTSLERRQLTSDLVLSASLNSSGRTACFSSDEGMIQCLDVDSGVKRILLDRTPRLDVWNASEGYAPGGRYRLTGGALSGAIVKVNGGPASVLQSSEQALTFIVPLDAEPGNAIFEADQPSSPFVSRISTKILSAFPRVIKLSEIEGVHPDRQHLPYLENGTRGGLGGEMDPFLPGEVVWIHMTGLGREPESLRWLWGASLASPGIPIAPDEIVYEDGWYTVKIRIPEDADPVVARIGCVVSGNEQYPHWVEIPVTSAPQ